MTKGNATNGSAINSNGDLDLNGVTFTENVAVDCGGAIYTKQGTVIIEGCVFDSNDLTNRADGYNKDYGGAAIYSVGGTLNINNSKFTNNLLNYYPGENGKNRDLITAAVTSSGVTIINNTAFENNSGCYGADINVFKSSQITDPASLTVDNSNFTNSRSYAGGIQINNINYTITNSNFDNGTAYGIGSTGYTASGGAIYARNCNNGIIKDSNFTNCGNTQGGAIDIEQSKSLLIDGCLFENNTVSGAGGAIAIMQSSGDVTITNTDFINNTAGGNAGAVYYLTVSDNKLTISDCEFVDSSSGTNGGAIAALMYPNGSVEIKNSNFTNNAATKGAGAILFYTSGSGNELTVSNCNFTDNSAATADAIYTYPNTVTKITDSTFTNNGGAADYAIYNRGTLSLARNTIDNLVYSSGALISTINATFLFEAENNTIPAELYQTVVPYGNLTDDNGNIIYDPSFKITVDGVEYNTTFDEATGKYSANYTVSHAGENIVSTNYDATNIIKGIFDVPKANVTVFTVTVDDILDNESATVVIELLGIDSEKLSANVTVILNNTKYTVEVINGTGNMTLADLTHGQYPVTALFDGDVNYNDAINSTVFYVKSATTLIVEPVSVVANYSEEVLFTVNLTDSQGNPMTAIVEIVGIKKVYVEDGIGYFLVDIQPDVGVYNFTAVYAGDNDYLTSSADFTLEVIQKIITEDDFAIVATGVAPDDDVNFFIVGPDATYNVTVGEQTIQVVVENGTGEANMTLSTYGELIAYIAVDDPNYRLDDNLTKYAFSYKPDRNLTIEFNGTYPEVVITITNADVDGLYEVSLFGREESVIINVTNRQGSATITGLNASDYLAIITANETEIYNGYYDDVLFTVEKADATLEVFADDIAIGDVAHIDIYAASGDNNITVDVKVTVDNETYDVTVVDGEFILDVPDLDLGFYDVSVAIVNDNYNFVSASWRFVVKHNSKLTVETTSDSYVYGSDAVIVIKLEDVNSQYNQYMINIDINGVPYTVVVMGNVSTAFNISDLEVGEYTVTSYFEGDNINNYTEGNVVTFNVTPLKINSSDVTVKFTGHAPDGLTVTVTSPVDGNYTVAIGNQTNVTVEVIDGQGVATVDDLEIGYYVATTTIDDPNYTLNNKYSLVAYTMVPEFDATITGIYPTATVTISGPAGYYIVVVRGVGYAFVNVTEDGVFASGTIENITAGDYNATVVYLYGNGTYGLTEKEVPFTVDKAEALNITYDGSYVVMGGGDVNITVAEDATGYVIIDDNGVTKYAELVNGSYSFEIYDLTAGDYTITVTYYGDENYNKTEKTLVIPVPKTEVTLEISNVTAEIFETQEATFTVSINNDLADFVTGNVTIFVNGVENQVVALDEYGNATVVISGLTDGNYTIDVQYNGDDNFVGAANATTSIRVYGNVVTNETFSKYFGPQGWLLSEVPFDELIFKGLFSDVSSSNVITVDRPIALTGSSDQLFNVFINTGLCIASNNVTVSNLVFLNNGTDFSSSNGGAAVYVYGENVTLYNVGVIYKAPENADPYAMYVLESNGFSLVDSVIAFYGHENNTNYQYGLRVADSNDVYIAGNTIVAQLPILPLNWTNTGIDIDKALAVGIQNGDDIVFAENTVKVTTIGNVTANYATLDAVMIYGVTNLEVSYNNITLTDTENTGIACFNALDLYSFDGVVEYNDIIVNTTAGIVGAGTAYAIQMNGPFDVIVDNNNLTAIGNGPAAGIMTATWKGAGDLTAISNYIEVCGSTGRDPYDLTTGIEIQATNARVYDNMIIVNTVSEFDESNNIFGISNAQYSEVETVDIRDNTVYVNGTYAVCVYYAEDANIVDNYLITEELYGDNAVFAFNDDYVIEANYPQDLNITVFVDDIKVSDPVEIEVFTNELFNGTVNVLFNGQEYQVNVTEGYGYIDLDSVPASNYTVNATYDGSTYFLPDANNCTFEVSKFASELTITVGDIVVDQDLEVNITLPFATGSVVLVFDDGSSAVVELTDGFGNYTIPAAKVTAGNHTITAIFTGNDDYEFAEAEYNFTVEKAENYTFEVNLTVDEIDIGENVTINVTLPEDANGKLIVSVDDEVVTWADVVNGTASVTIPANAFTAGEYNEIEVTYADDKYGETTKVTDIWVCKLPSNLTATADDIELGQNATIIVVLPTYIDGDVYGVFEGTTFEYDADDNLVITVEGLTEGTYTMIIYFEDDSIYEDNVTTVTFNVNKVVIPADQAFNITTPENATSPEIKLDLPDDATGFLLVDVDGQQTHVPVVNGTAVADIPVLPEGSYNATITYTGDDKYAPISTTQEVNVTSNVPENALNIPATGKSDAPTTYSISLPEDATGYLEVDVDGTKYAAPLNKGFASVSIPALSAGNHNVTVSYTGDNKYTPVTKSSTLSVSNPVFKITKNKNVAAVYSAKATYKVLVTRDGKAVGAGETVTFKYNGKTYTVKTDAKGYATFKPTTKVKVKKYTVTATYKGITVKNTVTIKHVLKVKNAKIKKSKKVNKIKVKTKKVNGKYLKGKKLTLKIKGKKVKAKTNKKGVATFKLKKSITKKLKAGKKYKFTVTYGKDKVTKKAKVKK